MLTLDELLGRLERARGGMGKTHCWVGPTPEVRFKTMLPAAVAAKVGYAPPEGALQPLESRAAALALSFLAANSLASASPSRPRDGLVQLARQAFMDLSTNAEFFSNGDWGEAWRKTTFGFRAISGRPYDGGVIGFDAYTAFIFWVEEG
jgi:hypothetical protein